MGGESSTSIGFSRRIPGNPQYQYLTNLNATTIILFSFFFGGANQDVDEHYLQIC